MSEGESENPKPTQRWWEESQIQRDNPASVEPQLPNYPRGVENPFNAWVVDNMSRFDGLELDGEATITNPAWDIWKHLITPAEIKGEAPARTYRLSYEEIAKKGKGWKLHLNFDPDDPKKVETIGTLLTALKENGAITTFKIGKGGGRSSEQAGKEATVYVGHRDKSQVVASLLEEGLADVLDVPEGETLNDDISFTKKVMGRFEVTQIDPDFHQYGAKGHPKLNKLTYYQKDQDDAQEIARADILLRQRYGAFYTGTSKFLTT